MNLPGRARAGLNEVQRLLRQQNRLERPRRQWVDDVIAWCHQHDIDLGPRLTSRALRFDAALLAEIDAVLESAHLAPLGRSISGLTSAPQPTPGVSFEPRSIRDVDLRSLFLGTFGALVQVENLDSFYAFAPNLAALKDFAQPLIAYRGDHHYGGGFAKLAEAWPKTRRPPLYLGDFDAKGVTLALDTGATHLLLPEIDWLTQHATALHQPAEQLEFQRRLRQLHVSLTPQHPLASYLALLEQNRGLRQQWFEGEVVGVRLA
ncbi:hypothetical protein HW452_06430 [Halomonas aquamarina]|uniref:Uncharacterized protein n=1 Tax=Vreelandella aquamarina TaxID=77097 RepID=A0ACC5VTS1_9GAMM|nr:hypothetical protein [Halomonas aquamarina]MBZ5487161.1 hypothetical protein [Halomonas aquamarina]